jgi:hypothetical protein
MFDVLDDFGIDRAPGRRSPRPRGRCLIGQVKNPRLASSLTVFDDLIRAAVEDSENRYRVIYENVSEGMYRSSLDGRQISANPALVCLIGYDSEAEMLAAVNDHDRMPVLLAGSEIDDWLSGMARTQILKRASESIPREWVVDKRMNRTESATTIRRSSGRRPKGGDVSDPSLER